MQCILFRVSGETDEPGTPELKQPWLIQGTISQEVEAAPVAVTWKSGELPWGPGVRKGDKEHDSLGQRAREKLFLVWTQGN